MPRVKPFYAVKCHPNLAMMGVLAAMGSGFDCASQGEIEMVTSLGEFSGLQAWHPTGGGLHPPSLQFGWAFANHLEAPTSSGK